MQCCYLLERQLYIRNDCTGIPFGCCIYIFLHRERQCVEKLQWEEEWMFGRAWIAIKLKYLFLSLSSLPIYRYIYNILSLLHFFYSALFLLIVPTLNSWDRKDRLCRMKLVYFHSEHILSTTTTTTSKVNDIRYTGACV